LGISEPTCPGDNDKPELILVLGGARSGKSTYAEELAAHLADRVLYVATAEALDEEMRARVISHRARRPESWQTLEASLDVGQALEAYAAGRSVDLVMLDCLTLLVSNAILSGGPDVPEPDSEEAWTIVQAEINALLAAHRRLGLPLIIVSNEVGMGVVPPYSLGRTYRDCLGWANQALARVADRVILMVAGLPVDAKSLPLAWPDHA
jgi:adenosylcobinamide kinase/adenosylcobinamide-phosphate guanylyltransferase